MVSISALVLEGMEKVRAERLNCKKIKEKNRINRAG
jgi:hypothetical protein